MIEQARILLCVSGGIAAYKAASLCSALVQRGATVDVMLTAEAERFVAPLTFASLTARPVFTSLWDAPERIPHIRLVREAQVAIVAPATANIIAKLASGVADDLVTTALLAARIPIVIAPAMNTAMYEHAQTQKHLATLRERGYTIVEPETGFLAERESGLGRLAGQERLLAAIERAMLAPGTLAGKRVVITAGATHEALDPVRFIANAASGATGIALANEAWIRGADVTLLLGPTTLRAIPEVRSFHATGAADLHELALTHAIGADLVIATAAVSDWRPQHPEAMKLKKSGDLDLHLVRTPDVLAALGERKGRTFLVGFAAETHEHERYAREKLVRKHLDAIVVNDVGEQRGFGAVENELTLLLPGDRRCELGRASKPLLAARLLDELERLMRERS